jgi:hypothetical protein
VIILRLARNEGIVEGELAKLQSLVDGLVQETYMQQPNVWAVKLHEAISDFAGCQDVFLKPLLFHRF